MTLLNVSLKPQEAHIITDTAISNPALGFIGYRTKPVILAHLRAVFIHTGTTWFSDTLGRWLNHAPLSDIEGAYEALPDVLRTIAALKGERYGEADFYEGGGEIGIIVGWSEGRKQCIGFRFVVDGAAVTLEWLKHGFIWQPGILDGHAVPSAAKVPDILVKIAEKQAEFGNAIQGPLIGGELLHVHIQRGGIRVAPIKPLYNHAEIKNTFASDSDGFMDISLQHLHNA